MEEHNINKVKSDIGKKLNRELFEQNEFSKELIDYFIGKILNKEYGKIVVAGNKNTFKKAGVKAFFEELKNNNLIKNNNQPQSILQATHPLRKHIVSKVNSNLIHL